MLLGLLRRGHMVTYIVSQCVHNSKPEAFLALIVAYNCETIGNGIEIIKIGKNWEIS